VAWHGQAAGRNGLRHASASRQTCKTEAGMPAGAGWAGGRARLPLACLGALLPLLEKWKEKTSRRAVLYCGQAPSLAEKEREDLRPVGRPLQGSYNLMAISLTQPANAT